MSQRPSACIPPPTDYTPKPRTGHAPTRYKERPDRGRLGHRLGGQEHSRQIRGISFHSDKQSSDADHDARVNQQPRDRFYRTDDDDYFARVQDEEDCASREIDNNIKSTECEDDNEDDPLDAYMKSLEGNSKSNTKGNSINHDYDMNYNEEPESIRSPAGLETERARAIRLDIEEGDDIEESYYKYVEEKKSKTMDEPEEDERLEQVEYDKDGNITGVRKIKREVAPLPPVDHSKIVYDKFEKKFYHEHEEIRKLSDEQTKELRAKLEIRVSGDSPPRPVCSFAHFKFDEKLMKVIRKSEYFQPTPIQAQAIPAALLGRNMIGIAMTGSGKTAAYLWPMVVHIMNQPRLKQGDGPIGLILVPTRELALQVYGEARKFSSSYKLSVVCAYGGGSRYEQSRDLEAGAEIVVATPGRIIDLIKSSATNLKRVTYLVLDEADRFFEMGFEAQVRSICDHVRPDRQTLLFSATFKHRVEQLARTVTDNPIKIIQKTLGEANEDVTQHTVVFTDTTKKWNWLEDRFVEFTSSGSVLIFVTRIANSEELQKRLADSGRSTLLLHGDMEQSERNRVITAFKRKECDVMIATDVAARGLDISHIKTVVNYDVARDIDTHIHRIGRTGRAGVKGDAYTLLSVEKDKEFAGHLVKNLESSNQKVDDDLLRLAMRSHTFRKSIERNKQKRHYHEHDYHHQGHSSIYEQSHHSADRRSSNGRSDHSRHHYSHRDRSQHRSYQQDLDTSSGSMAKSSRPRSPGSTITTSSIKEGPGGRKYTTRIEKTKPTYSFKVQTETTTQSAIPEEVELDGKHFTKWPGILKLLQLAVAILCMIFFSPPLTWFTRVLCAVVASCFAITIFVCLFYLFTLRRVVKPSWPWLKIEMHYTNIAAAFYLVASLLQLIYTNKEEYKISLTFHDYYHDYLVAGVIGLINFVLYGLGGQLLDNKLKAQRARQTKVCIVRTTLDRKGKPVKKTIKKAQHVKVHRIDFV